MALFGKRTQLVRVAVGVLCGAALSAAAVRADGTLKITRTSTLVNPCNGELITGLVDVELVVQANEGPNGTRVMVHRSFHGTLTGDQGNTYKVSSIANDHFDALAPAYALTFDNNVVGLGRAPNFTVEGNLTVFVDANQQPTNYGASATGSTCK